jgi:hypothetical protein
MQPSRSSSVEPADIDQCDSADDGDDDTCLVRVDPATEDDRDQGTLGEGLPLFEGLTAAPAQFVDAQIYNTGAALHV